VKILFNIILPCIPRSSKFSDFYSNHLYANKRVTVRSRILVTTLIVLHLFKKFHISPPFSKGFIIACTIARYLLLIHSEINSVRNTTICFFNTHCNVFVPSTARSSGWTLFFKYPYEKSVRTGLFKMIVGVLTTCHTQYTSFSRCYPM